MDFELTEKDFNNFSSLIYDKAGINLHEGKKELLKARLAKYLRNTNFRSVREYYRYLMEEDVGEEMVNLLNTISTNLTYFFREPKHYDFLKDKALPILADLCRKQNKGEIRVWSAGCSSGEEAYSLGIILSEYLGIRNNPTALILATDISTKVLGKASDGIYLADRLENIPYELKRRYFQRGVNKWSGFFRVRPQLRGLVTFKRLNLMESFPAGETFQIIFCRNVMIYFDRPTQERIVAKFCHALEQDGFLFIGHAESLTGINHSLKYVQPGVYTK